MIYSLKLDDAQDYEVGKIITGDTSGSKALISKIVGNIFYVTMTSERKMFIDTTIEQDGEGITVESSALTTEIDTALGLISLVTQKDLFDRAPLINKYQWDTDSDYIRIIEKAFEEVQASLNHRGIDSRRIRQKNSAMPRFKTLHEYKCLELIFDILRKQEGDPCDLKYTRYMNLYYEGAKNVQYDYDEDKSGSIDENEKDYSSTQVRFIR